MTFKIIPGLAGIAANYDAFILDLWGVVHNGHAPYPGALDCMAKLRAGGRQIILVSNAPRTSNFVISFLEGIGVPRASFDHILTSGDLTREALIERSHAFLKDRGRVFYQIGATRDKGLEDGLDYTRVFTLEEANFIICTGLVDDETETPDDYRALLGKALSLDLPMLCANPDLTVMRGQNMIYCAGSVAALYAEMGGRVALFGKPYPEVYRKAMRTLGISDTARILALGDSMRTDIRGASTAGIDSVLVSGGIHADEWGLAAGALPSEAQVAAVVRDYAVTPTYVTGHMVW